VFLMREKGFVEIESQWTAADRKLSALVEHHGCSWGTRQGNLLSFKPGFQHGIPRN
jgi:hypothetical protein